MTHRPDRRGFDSLEQELVERESQRLYRRRRLLQSPQQPALHCDGRELLGFCSNDYLGLANHPRVVESLQRAASRYGVGGGASHLVIGHSEPHHALEEALAAFTGRERVLLFSSGYMANTGVITALLDKRDAVFEDRLNHASLIDGGLLSGARFKRYLHNDVDSLRQRLNASSVQRKLVVTDGVFSMDGDLAPLPELAQLCQQQGAWLMVDDAHGFGVLGETGGGCAEYFGLGSDQLPVLVGTLGKGFGTAGAFVAGSATLIETLIQQARSYIYTTSMPPAVAAATLESLQLLKEEGWRRTHLAQLIARFRAGALALGLRLMDSTTPIQPILVGDAGQALALSQRLETAGVLVSAIRPPTVPRGTARLRVTLSASHSEQDVDRLLEALAKVTKEQGVGGE
ncbi:8-amino-7-oxononanoate synthase [Aestuariirhabdus litorea]|uniref:8-amino-7-oxononanoate synthase n=1 Tax=Aestuariirhabdus litorea TaxID=2528527 RepID=A0A3P3VNE1_9GAMM|nr:8-amino-7-oxononanoate synthase [Aestuariirhabdus litorea]RRJ83166.1 8-amino-7-oxononanoate synthase [Aestuariirhabdus litorea]RWW93323.1 8-amino-7-oxononanoate synthase [Endozoicomonadaceae bacterium GTF-13]